MAEETIFQYLDFIIRDQASSKIEKTKAQNWRSRLLTQNHQNFEILSKQAKLELETIRRETISLPRQIFPSTTIDDDDVLSEPDEYLEFSSREPDPTTDSDDEYYSTVGGRLNRSVNYGKYQPIAEFLWTIGKDDAQVDEEAKLLTRILEGKHHDEPDEETSRQVLEVWSSVFVKLREETGSPLNAFWSSSPDRIKKGLVEKEKTILSQYELVKKQLSTIFTQIFNVLETKLEKKLLLSVLWNADRIIKEKNQALGEILSEQIAWDELLRATEAEHNEKQYFYKIHALCEHNIPFDIAHTMIGQMILTPQQYEFQTAAIPAMKTLLQKKEGLTFGKMLSAANYGPELEPFATLLWTLGVEDDGEHKAVALLEQVRTGTANQEGRLYALSKVSARIDIHLTMIKNQFHLFKNQFNQPLKKLRVELDDLLKTLPEEKIHTVQVIRPQTLPLQQLREAVLDETLAYLRKKYWRIRDMFQEQENWETLLRSIEAEHNEQDYVAKLELLQDHGIPLAIAHLVIGPYLLTPNQFKEISGLEENAETSGPLNRETNHYGIYQPLADVLMDTDDSDENAAGKQLETLMNPNYQPGATLDEKDAEIFVSNMQKLMETSIRTLEYNMLNSNNKDKRFLARIWLFVVKVRVLIQVLPTIFNHRRDAATGLLISETVKLIYDTVDEFNSSAETGGGAAEKRKHSPEEQAKSLKRLRREKSNPELFKQLQTAMFLHSWIKRYYGNSIPPAIASLLEQYATEIEKQKQFVNSPHTEYYTNQFFHTLRPLETMLVQAIKVKTSPFRSFRDRVLQFSFMIWLIQTRHRGEKNFNMWKDVPDMKVYYNLVVDLFKLLMELNPSSRHEGAEDAFEFKLYHDLQPTYDTLLAAELEEKEEEEEEAKTESQMSLLLSIPGPFSGILLDTTSRKIPLSFSLTRVLYPVPKEKYYLSVFVGGETPSNFEIPALNQIITKSFHCNSIADLQFWLYTTNEEDHFVTQTLLAWNSSPINTTTVSLIDIKKQVQATLTIQNYNARHPFTVDSRDNDNLSIDRMIQDTQDMYSHYTFVPSLQAFYRIKSPCGNLPIISFPMLASFVEPQSDSEQLFEVWYQYCNQYQGMECVSEMVTLIVRNLIYRYDTIRGKRKKKRNVDQWVRLGCFPSLKDAGYDCEDAAEYILELLTLFGKVKFKAANSPLQQLQELYISNYTPFLALGQLNLNPGYTAHAFVVLLDKRYPENGFKTNRRYHPAVVIEPTSYTESVWSNTEDHTTTTFLKAQQLFEGKPEFWTSMIHNKMPVSEVKRQNMYGPLTALISKEKHYLLIQDKNIGVEFNRVIEYQSGFHYESLKLNLDVIQQKITNSLPLSTIPSAPSSSSFSFSSSKIQYFIREQDYNRYKIEINSVLTELYPNRWKSQIWDLGSGVSSVVISCS